MPKDVDRLISVPLYWSNEMGWHHHSEDEWTGAGPGGTHRREFASWVGPLLPRVPVESRSEIEGEIERSCVAADARARAVPTAERVEQLAAFGRSVGSGVVDEPLMGLAVAELAAGCSALLALRAEDAVERAVLRGEIERLSGVPRASVASSQPD